MSSLPHGDAATVSGPWQPETPFLGLAPAEPSLRLGMAQTGPSSPMGQSTTEAPFVAEYRLGDEVVDLGAAEARAFFSELLDPEFDEAMEELLNEAETEVERLGTDESATGASRAERLLERWIEPLRSEAEGLFERMAYGLDTAQVGALSETELDKLLQRYEPRETDLPPVFENFLGKLWKKAKGAVKGAVRLAKKISTLMPIGLILRRLAGLVRPLFKRFVNMAQDKLSPALRPYGAILAKKFTGELAEFEELGRVPAAADTRVLQLGFDSEITELFFAPDEFAQEELVTEAIVASAAEIDILGELDDARARFLTQFQALEAGEDPTPVVEEFLPAVLPALRIGIRMAGRPKVVSFLARYLGRLIAPYVGPQIAPALSQAIVDAGLRLMTLESPAEPTPGIAGEAFANAIEDTVRRVSELAADELEDELTLETVAYEGFQEAVAANFPIGMLDPASEYLETSQPAGTWVSMPRGGHTRYRKHTGEFPVTVTVQAANAIRTFGGRTLGAFLRDQLGRTGVVHGRLHLYQAVPGTRIGRILRAERRSGRTGRSSERIAVHPLTREAAGILLGEPGLGREVDEASFVQPEPLAVGERLYYLEVPGARPHAGRSSSASMMLDLRAREIRLTLNLSESDAQTIAVRLRRKEPLGAALAALRRIYRPAIRTALANPRGQIRIIREEPEPQDLVSGMFQLARSPSLLLANAIERWTGRALGVELARQRDAFAAATAEDSDGVTLLVSLSDPPGLQAIASLLSGGAGGRTVPAGLWSLADLHGLLNGYPRAGVQIRPGHHRA
ncbi:hypothetical protein [Nonomuraea sp. NEAU-A123]|uniref:hypothetical protein n=1 Tax=Nonomuraea sp. NEAU-A123 TaxID=2839649 RepID=UPI001BE44F93|nr:hypothetical protein [Nonomuraea sp. NEAU-A123]MBT2234275.1 hypothetical protein [Nonomuraea sp. NEAU-A123]